MSRMKQTKRTGKKKARKGKEKILAQPRAIHKPTGSELVQSSSKQAKTSLAPVKPNAIVEYDLPIHSFGKVLLHNLKQKSKKVRNALSQAIVDDIMINRGRKYLRRQEYEVLGQSVLAAYPHLKGRMSDEQALKFWRRKIFFKLRTNLRLIKEEERANERDQTDAKERDQTDVNESEQSETSNIVK